MLDRLSEGHLLITQEIIANLVGVRRESVTEAAGKLQKLGVIEYRRGCVTVLDRDKLLDLIFECYAIEKHETGRLLPQKKIFIVIIFTNSSRRDAGRVRELHTQHRGVVYWRR